MISITFVFEAKGQETPEAQKAWTFSVYFENDLFTHTDKHYTNGTKLSWISPDLTSYKTTLAGGGTGPAVVPGDPDASLIIKRQTGDLPHFTQLTLDEIQLIIDWIDAGAPEE